MELHLNAAIGDLEIEVIVESAGELENLPPEDRSNSIVLCGRMEIFRSANKKLSSVSYGSGIPINLPIGSILHGLYVGQLQ